MMERRIRSFVLRQGRLTPGQEKALEETWPTFGCELKDGALVFADLFGNRNPVHLEIGFGLGESLATQALENPDINYIGVEVHRPGVGHLLMLLRDQGLGNVRVFAEDSIEVLNQCIADGSLERVQIFFPDPWPKKRHHKRRIMQPAFVGLLERKLTHGGMIHFATDWEPYAEDVETLLEAYPDFQRVDAPARPETKFERRGLRLGHKINDLAWLSKVVK
ncbi:MAG: tRNA (guanosine(46)-N7)-methyltransferase TrmB [Pseudomonadales bacterium]|jgi:tRNA (guanine-N7-)-methyltransferase|nr:tRNA (guanosine(46)-N7)-methyltransferase TrmB [Pseudomonadales bacterium]